MDEWLVSAEKTLEILDLFDLDTRELSVPQIAELLKLPQSSVYRYLRVLKEKGYVIEINGGTYKLGYRFLKMAKIVRADINISKIVLPIMRNLTKETEETSIFTIASGLNVVCLETVSSPQPIKVSAEQGQILPLYAGASSKPLLAYMPDETVDELFKKSLIRKHTEKTIIDPVQLRADLEEIRVNGYSVSDCEVDEGVLAYGVPICDFDDKVFAALSIAGPRERLLEKNFHVMIQSLQSAVQEIQKCL